MNYNATLNLHGYKGAQPVTVPMREFFAIEEDVIVNTREIAFPECKGGHTVVDTMTISVSEVGGAEIGRIHMDVVPVMVFKGVSPRFSCSSICIDPWGAIRDALK